MYYEILYNIALCSSYSVHCLYLINTTMQSHDLIYMHFKLNDHKIEFSNTVFSNFCDVPIDH